MNGGWDVNTHSVSHESGVPPPLSLQTIRTWVECPAMRLRTLSIPEGITTSMKLTIFHSASVYHDGELTYLTVTTTPNNPAADVSWNLTPAAPGQPPTELDKLGGIFFSLERRGVLFGKLSGHLNAKSTGHSISLGDVTDLDIESAAQNLDLDRDADGDGTDELGRGVDEFKIYPAFRRILCHAKKMFRSMTKGIAAGLGYVGMHGTGSLKAFLAGDSSLAPGCDLADIARGPGIVPNYQGMTYAGMRNRVSQDSCGERVVGTANSVSLASERVASG